MSPVEWFAEPLEGAMLTEAFSGFAEVILQWVPFILIPGLMIFAMRFVFSWFRLMVDTNPAPRKIASTSTEAKGGTRREHREALKDIEVVRKPRPSLTPPEPMESPRGRALILDAFTGEDALHQAQMRWAWKLTDPDAHLILTELRDGTVHVAQLQSSADVERIVSQWERGRQPEITYMARGTEAMR